MKSAKCYEVTDIEIPSHVIGTYATLSAISDNVLLVGGCVRDLLLGLPVKDWDFVTSTPMDELEEKLSLDGWKTDATGKAFLVLNASKDGHQYEIANYRKDGVYTDGRRPESVEIGTMYEDACRRDFTVNALYLDIGAGLVYDPINMGMKDLNSRVLRFVGKPQERLQEDYLRGFRFYRFLQKGFAPHPAHLRAVRENWQKIFESVNHERARIEIERMCGL